MGKEWRTRSGTFLLLMVSKLEFKKCRYPSNQKQHSSITSRIRRHFSNTSSYYGFLRKKGRRATNPVWPYSTKKVNLKKRITRKTKSDEFLNLQWIMLLKPLKTGKEDPCSSTSAPWFIMNALLVCITEFQNGAMKDLLLMGTSLKTRMAICG